VLQPFFFPIVKPEGESNTAFFFLVDGRSGHDLSDEQSESKTTEGSRSKRFGLAKTWLASKARWPKSILRHGTIINW